MVTDTKEPSRNPESWWKVRENLILVSILLLAGAMFIWAAVQVSSVWSGKNTSLSDGQIPQDKIEIRVTIAGPIEQLNAKSDGQAQHLAESDVWKKESELMTHRLNDAVNSSLDQVLAGKLEPIHNRVGDTWSSVQGIGLVSGIIGVLITVLVLYFSFSNASQIAEARQEIDRRIDKVDANNDAILTRLKRDIRESAIDFKIEMERLIRIEDENQKNMERKFEMRSEELTRKLNDARVEIGVAQQKIRDTGTEMVNKIRREEAVVDKDNKSASLRKVYSLKLAEGWEQSVKGILEGKSVELGLEGDLNEGDSEELISRIESDYRRLTFEKMIESLPDVKQLLQNSVGVEALTCKYSLLHKEDKFCLLVEVAPTSK